MNKEEQKLKVLQMLKEDMITQEQALDLLELIASETKVSENNQSNEVKKEENTTSMVQPQQPYDFFGNGHQLFKIEKTVNLDNFKSLKLIGKNSHIKVSTHLKRTIEINGWYKQSRHNDPMICFDENNGNYQLSYNYHGVKYLGCEVMIPETFLSLLAIENSNAAVSLNNINSSEIFVKTKNAQIELSKCQSDVLTGITKNSHINLIKYRGARVELVTTNARIFVKDATAKEAEFRTTNADILVQNSHFMKQSLETKNAQITLDLMSQAFFEEGHYEIDGRTTNANIEVLLPEGEEVPFRINGSTKRGNVVTQEANLVVNARDRGYLVAESKAFNSSNKKMIFNFQTTNGDIILKETFFD